MYTNLPLLQPTALQPRNPPQVILYPNQPQGDIPAPNSGFCILLQMFGERSEKGLGLKFSRILNDP
jgi:hypothetical protein